MDHSAKYHYSHLPPSPPLSRDDFHVAVFCALPHEANKVTALFDIDWRKQNISFGKASDDSNKYTLGSIGRHNVVLVHLARIGANEANTAAATISRSFAYINIIFVVGTCGVVPLHNQRDVMLGDCIISTAIIQYDFGRQYPDTFTRKVDVEDVLGRAGRKITNFLALLQAQTDLDGELVTNLSTLQQKKPSLNADYPTHGDVLFDPDYIHTHHDQEDFRCVDCIPSSGVCKSSCQELHCDDDKIIRRTTEWHPPKFHFGRIGSANTVMKSGKHRDRLAKLDNLLAFETEGCGVWDHYPTIVVKSAGNYADSHKSLEWQEYASAVAACGFKTLLGWLESEDSTQRDAAPPAIFLASTSLDVQPREVSPGINQRFAIIDRQDAEAGTAEDDIHGRLEATRDNGGLLTHNLSRPVADLNDTDEENEWQKRV